MNRIASGLISLTVAAAVLAACAGGSPETDVVLSEDEEECPHTWYWARDGERRELNQNIEAFTGERDEVPEYNDCQRFFLGSRDSAAYGPLAAIFISDSIATKRPRTSTAAMPAALVWSDGPYEPLGIGSGEFHCLVMRPTNAQGTQWEASMAPAPAGNCRQPEMDKAVELEVKAWPDMPDGHPLEAGDLPGTVRWAFDDQRDWVQYAVLPCETSNRSRICNVGPGASHTGPGGFQPMPAPALLNRISAQLPRDGRERQVDMWNDAQYLADPASTSGPSQPARPLLMGVLMPDPLLAERDTMDFHAGWVPVAEVAISGPSDYESKLNFAPTTGEQYNRIEACYYVGSSPGNCEGLPPGLDSKCGVSSTGKNWRSRHSSATGAVTYHCVELTLYPNQRIQPPGTVRWKWLRNDEKAWFRCPEGCCKVLT